MALGAAVVDLRLPFKRSLTHLPPGNPVRRASDRRRKQPRGKAKTVVVVLRSGVADARLAGGWDIDSAPDDRLGVFEDVRRRFLAAVVGDGDRG